MSLIVFLEPDNFARAALWRDTASGETGQSTPLAMLAAEAPAKREVVLVLPGEAALTRDLVLPMKRQRDLRRAADLAVEDQLASPMEDRRLAFGPAEEGRRLVTAMPGALLLEAIESAEEEGLSPDRVTVDHALLPAPGEEAAVMLSLEGRTMMRAREGAFTAEEGFAAEMAALLGAKPRLLGWEDLASPEKAPNFRTGALAKREPLPDLRPYLLAASLVLAAGVVFLLASLTEGMRYQGEADRMRASAEAAFLEANPGTPIFDLERQIGGTRRAAVSSDFLPLTAILAEALEDQPETSLSSLNYGEEGELTAELTFSSFGDLERLKTQLSARGVAAEEGGDARREDGAFITRLFLRAA